MSLRVRPNTPLRRLPALPRLPALSLGTPGAVNGQVEAARAVEATEAAEAAVLRFQKHAALKNALMMKRLLKENWFVEFRRQLADFRAGNGPRPRYPTEDVDNVEKAVDQWMVEHADASAETVREFLEL